jgi:hypothetical protein
MRRRVTRRNSAGRHHGGAASTTATAQFVNQLPRGRYLLTLPCNGNEGIDRTLGFIWW